MKKYVCKQCGRELRPMLLWTCPDDTRAAQLPGGVVIDHNHQPDRPYDLSDKTPVDYSAWRFTKQADLNVTGTAASSDFRLSGSTTPPPIESTASGSDHQQQPPRPTRGQQRIMQLCCRVNYVLIGEQWPHAPEPEYNLRERSTGRLIQVVTPRMFTGLLRAGWIELAPRATGLPVTAFHYRVTTAGIAAANGPTRGE